jgi:hypothetical protein
LSVHHEAQNELEFLNWFCWREKMGEFLRKNCEFS